MSLVTMMIPGCLISFTADIFQNCAFKNIGDRELSISCTEPFYSVSFIILIVVHYENTPIQIYRKFHYQKLKIFR